MSESQQGTKLSTSSLTFVCHEHKNASAGADSGSANKSYLKHSQSCSIQDLILVRPWYLCHPASKYTKTKFQSLKLKQWDSKSAKDQLRWDRRTEFHTLFSEYLRTAEETKSHFHANSPSNKNVSGQKIWCMNSENQV